MLRQSPFWETIQPKLPSIGDLEATSSHEDIILDVSMDVLVKRGRNLVDGTWCGVGNELARAEKVASNVGTGSS